MALRLIFNRQFGFLFWGKTLGSVGVWAHNMLAAIVAFQATHSAAVVGAATVVQFVPQLVLGPISGKWTDRSGALRQILIGRLLCGVGSGGLAVWLACFGVDQGIRTAAAVVSSSFIVGLGFVAGGPALQSAVPNLVKPDQMPVAMALNTFPLTIARAAGPAIGAVIAATMSPAIGFALAGGCQLVFIGLMAGLRWPQRVIPPPGTDFSVRASILYVRRDRPLYLALLGVAAAGIGSEPAITLAPSLAHSLGGEPSVAGWLGSAFGIGAATGVTFVILGSRWIDRSRQGVIGLGLLALALLAAAVVQTVPLAVVAMGVAGIGMTVSLTGLSTLVQERAPQELRGRIMALWLVCYGGSRPFAAAVTGLLADAISVGFALAATAALLLGACGMLRPRALRGGGVP